MIENLKGIHETVNYKGNTNLRLYNNDKHEDYPEHWHTPLEIIMPTKNDYTVLLGGNSYHLNEGDIAFICPGVIHALRAPAKGKRIIFQAEVTMLHEISELESVLSLISPLFIVTPESFPDIHVLLRKYMFDILNEYESDSPFAETAIYSILLSMFAIIGKNYTAGKEHFDVGNQKQKEYNEKFISICNYINQHCTEDLTLEQVAEMAGFSKYHFSRLFKQFTNVTFYKYLNQKRISRAEKLLINSETTVTEVALQSGFSSMSAFIRMFKIVKLCTPTEFRNMYQN